MKKEYYNDEEFKENFEIIKKFVNVRDTNIRNANTFYYPTVSYIQLKGYTLAQQKEMINWIFSDDCEYSTLYQRICIIESVISSNIFLNSKKLFFKLLIKNQDRFTDKKSLYRDVCCSFGSRYKPTSSGLKRSRRPYYPDREMEFHKVFIKPYLEQIKFPDEQLIEIINDYYYYGTSKMNESLYYRGYKNAVIFNCYLNKIEEDFGLHLGEYKLKDILNEDGAIYEE